MKKLKLNLEDLEVESFETTSEVEESQKGTVFGYIPDTSGPTCAVTCWHCEETNQTCNPTCGATCNPTCPASCSPTCPASCNGTCGSPTCGVCGPGLTCQPICDTSFACGFCTGDC